MRDPADTDDEDRKCEKRCSRRYDGPDLGVPGGPISITIPDIPESRARVNQDAFSTYVAGRVHGALAKAYAAFAIERRQWVAERAQWRRELISENVLLEAVLRKFNISLHDAKAALAEYNMVGPQ